VHETSGTIAFDVAYVRKIDKQVCEDFVARLVEAIREFRDKKSSLDRKS
jgi:hypothetical protein